MQQLAQFEKQIRGIDVNAHKVQCEFSIWMDQFAGNHTVQRKIEVISRKLTSRFGRSDLVNLYKSECDNETRFLAAMIWGHAAPANGKRDSRGPWKVEKTLKSLKDSPNLLNGIQVDKYELIGAAYKGLKKTLVRCGPNFFSKHLYFVGKAAEINNYPLIFDDRVASGLVRLALSDGACTDLVTIHAKTKQNAYLAYLRFAHEQAKRLKCEPDQIELFLFELGGKSNAVSSQVSGVSGADT